MHVSRALRPLRRLLLVALLASGTLLGSAAGAGAKTIVTIGGSASPAITAFTTTPQTLGLTVDVRFKNELPDTDPDTVKQATVYFPHGPRVNGALFPSCNAAKLRRLHGFSGACPRGSRIGSGSALGTSPQFHGLDEQLKVELYNGRRGRSIIFHIHGENPVAINGIIEAPFDVLRSHRWGYRLTLKVPRDLQEIASGIFASLLRFTTKVDASVRVREHGRMVRHGYIEVLACPPGALVPVRGVFAFLDAPTVTTDSYIACR